MVRSRSRPAGTAAVYRASETAMAPAMVSSLLWSGKQLVALDKAPGVSLATPRRDPGLAVERLLASLAPADRAALARSRSISSIVST